MTAEKLIEKKFKGSVFKINKIGMIVDYFFTVDELSELMNEYAKQKCKEQREICYKTFQNGGKYDTYEKVIKNAPEPDFE